MDPARFAAAPADEGERLDKVLCRRFGLARAQAAALLRRGVVALNGRKARGGLLLRAGDEVILPDLAAGDTGALLRPPEPSAQRRLVLPHGRGVPILYEDDRLLVLLKPPGVPVHAGPKTTDTLEPLLARAFPAPPSGGRGFFFVHRLDQEASGALLVAKGDPATARALIRLFRERRVEKDYLALVEGKIRKAGEIALPLEKRAEADPARARIAARGSGRRPAPFRSVPAEGGAEAVTRYEPAEVFRETTWLRVRMESGRMHQIRAHLAAIGHPLAVDPVYGRPKAIRLREILPGAPADRGEEVVLSRVPLHASRLAFPHPITGRPVVVEAPLPGDLRRLLKVLRKAARAGAGTG